ncbi:hypothetical protein [Corynebacterium accolens]|uniref:hypothetical protein n=1 Tax=Corynebacterium accolens TaxID=38284 RepID=UPI00254D383A|nr:hypothetical protein [Corynebacterium accolens]MDK8593926.1 hypothetical protein [Corynebacterium accolens]
MSELSSRASAEIELVNEHGTNNYGPLPVVLAEGKGAWGPTPGQWTRRGLAMLLWSV